MENQLGPFTLPIPQGWNCIYDKGVVRANKNDEIRLNISLSDMSQSANYTLKDLFDTIVGGYFNADIDWAVHSQITKKENFIYQTMEYGDDPNLILAVVEKIHENRKLVLIISFAGNTGTEVETYRSTFTEFIDQVSIL